MAKMQFLKRVQLSPKIKAVKKKIAANDVKRKVLSREYNRLIKSESKRIAKTLKPKGKKRSTKKKTTKKRRR